MQCPPSYPSEIPTSSSSQQKLFEQYLAMMTSKMERQGYSFPCRREKYVLFFSSSMLERCSPDLRTSLPCSVESGLLRNLQPLPSHDFPFRLQRYSSPLPIDFFPSYFPSDLRTDVLPSACHHSICILFKLIWLLFQHFVQTPLVGHTSLVVKRRPTVRDSLPYPGTSDRHRRSDEGRPWLRRYLERR